MSRSRVAAGPTTMLAERRLPTPHVGSSLVVDPPTHEVRPRLLDGAFDRKVDSAQTLDSFEEILIGKRDPVPWVGVLRDRYP